MPSGMDSNYKTIAKATLNVIYKIYTKDFGLLCCPLILNVKSSG